MKALVVFFLLFFTPQSFSQTKLVPKPGSAVVGGGGGGGGLTNPVTNNTWLQWKNSVNANTNVLRLNDSDVLQMGLPSYDFQLESSSAQINSAGDISVVGDGQLLLQSGANSIVVGPNNSLTGEIQFYDAAGNFYTGIRSANTNASNVSYTLPSADGTSGQALVTNGSGVLSWGSSSPSFPLLGTAGSASAPTYSFSADSNTGMYSPASDEIAFTVGGGQILKFSASGFTPGTASAFDMGSSSLYWATVYTNVFSAQAGLRVHSSGFGTGAFILAKGLPSPSGATLDGFWGESGAVNSYGFTAGSDVSSGSQAKGIYVEAQNNTSSGAGGIVSIRGGNSTSGDGGGIRFITPGTKPTCASGIRGMYWHTYGGTGVKDSVEVCVKNNADAYIWHSIY